jgi:hypothetical protein
MRNPVVVRGGIGADDTYVRAPARRRVKAGRICTTVHGLRISTRPTRSTKTRSSSCNGATSPACGTCAHWSIFLCSTRPSRWTRMPNSLGVIVMQPRYWVRCAASSLMSAVGSSDHKDLLELGAEHSAWWVEGVGRAMEFRRGFGSGRFVDVSLADLRTNPVNTVGRSNGR